MISKKELSLRNNFVFIASLKKFVSIKTKKLSNFSDLLGIDGQKKKILDNTYSFIDNKPFNNVLLWGAKGMGKSSLIIATSNYINKKLKNKIKVLEIFSTDLNHLPEILYKIRELDYKFIIFIDDITLDKNNNDFRTFKVATQGSLLSFSENTVFYITSNIRNIIKPTGDEDLNDLQIKDSKNNSLALSDRFGLCISFHRSNKKLYIEMIKFYAERYNIYDLNDSFFKEAMQWSIDKGDFSGRVAHQFVISKVKYKTS